MPDYWRKLRWGSWLALAALLFVCSVARCEPDSTPKTPLPTKTFRF
jgi:hypothetical protein